MKHLINSVLLMYLPYFAISQVPMPAVSAPILEAQVTQQNSTLISTLNESLLQSQTLANSYDLAKESVDALTKVSSVVRGLKMISNILQSQFNIIELTVSVSNQINSMELKPSTIESAVNVLSDAIESNGQNMELSRALLDDGSITTDTGNRLLILQDIKDRTKAIESDIEGVLRRCKSYDSRNRMYLKIRGRY